MTRNRNVFIEVLIKEAFVVAVSFDLTTIQAAISCSQNAVSFQSEQSSRNLIGIHANHDYEEQNAQYKVAPTKTFIIDGFCFGSATATQTTFNMKNGFLITDSCQHSKLTCQQFIKNSPRPTAACECVFPNNKCFFDQYQKIHLIPVFDNHQNLI